LPRYPRWTWPLADDAALLKSAERAASTTSATSTQPPRSALAIAAAVVGWYLSVYGVSLDGLRWLPGI